MITDFDPILTPSKTESTSLEISNEIAYHLLNTRLYQNTK